MSKIGLAVPIWLKSCKDNNFKRGLEVLGLNVKDKSSKKHLPILQILLWNRQLKDILQSDKVCEEFCASLFNIVYIFWSVFNLLLTTFDKSISNVFGFFQPFKRFRRVLYSPTLLHYWKESGQQRRLFQGQAVQQRQQRCFLGIFRVCKPFE